MKKLVLAIFSIAAVVLALFAIDSIKKSKEAYSSFPAGLIIARILNDGCH